MRSLILFFLALTFSTPMLAQHSNDFAPIGATWEFEERYAFGRPGSGILTVKSVGTTVVQGRETRILERSHRWCNLREATEWIHYRNDSLFYFDFDKDKFNLLIDFSAEAGESWTLELWEVYLREIESIEAYVKSTGYYHFNNDSLKTMEVELRFPNGTATVSIRERVGFIDNIYGIYPFVAPACDGPYLTDIYCYQDPEIGLIGFDECEGFGRNSQVLLPEIEKQWNIVTHSEDGIPIATTAYRTGRKRILANKTYTEIESTTDPNYENWEATSFLLREGLFDEKLYRFNVSTGEEDCLFDYLRLHSDQVTTDENGCYYDLLGKRSISLHDGSQRSEYILKVLNSSAIDYWIEGIGSIGGFITDFDENCEQNNTDYLSCYYENGELIYQAEGACFLTSTNELFANEAIKIFPNPVNENLQLDLSTLPNQEVQAHIFSSTGVLLQEMSFYSGHIETISTMDLPKGLYFLQIQNEERVFQTERFVRE